MIRILTAQFSADTCGCCCTVVTVGHIECRNAREDLCDACYILVRIDYPEMMTESVLCHEIIFGLTGDVAGYNFIYLGIVGICKEHRLDVGILNAHMNHAVIFLVLSCKFMLLDLACGIIVCVSAHYKAVLSASVHCLSIHVIARLAVLYQPSVLLPYLEILHSLVVCRLAVFVDYRIEIDFRLCDMKKGFFSGFSFRFHRVQHVVWACRNLFYILFWRSYRRKRFYSYHKFLLRRYFLRRRLFSNPHNQKVIPLFI